jgi:hypothetical protein
MTTALTTAIPRSIVYDRETRDYRMELDGQPVGYARTYHAAEIALDEMAFELLEHGLIGEVEQDEDAPFTDVCPSCGDQLTWEGPGLCAACQAAQLTCPQFVALAVRGAE